MFFSRFIETQSSIKGEEHKHHVTTNKNKMYNNTIFSPPYKLSQKYLDKMQFFKDGGSIAISFGECLSYDVEFKNLSKDNLPPFSKAFKEIILELYKASTRNVETKRKVFNKFRKLFGDYFFKHVQIGMQFSYTKLYPADRETPYTINYKPSTTTKQILHRKYVKSCSHRALARSIKINITKRYQQTECPHSVKQIVGEGLFRVNGGSFKVMMNMQNSDIWGNPVRFALAPITDLFNDQLFANNNISSASGSIVQATSINQWFLPMFLNKVKDYQVLNKCPESYKLYGNWEKHSCQGLYHFNYDKSSL